MRQRLFSARETPGGPFVRRPRFALHRDTGKKISRWLTAVVLVAGSPAPALAVNYTWSGSGADDLWSTAQNWRGGTAAVSATTTTVIFTGNTRPSPFTDLPFTLAGMTFNSAASAFTLSGTTITLAANGTVTNSSTSLQTITNSGIALSGASTWSAASGNLSVSSVLSGAGGVTKTGANGLTLSASNSYTGTTTLTAGTLSLGDDAAAGTGIFVFNGGTLQSAAGARTLANTVQLAATSGIGGASNFTFTNTLTNTGAFTLNVANTGATTLGAINLSSNATGRALTMNVTGGPVTISGPIANGGAGAGSLVKSGTGMLTLGSANSYTGATSVFGGSLVLGAGGALPASRAVVVSGTLANGSATLDLNGYDQSIGTLQFGSTASRANAVNTVATGSATLTLGGDVSYVTASGAANHPGTAFLTGHLDLGGATRTFSIADSANTATELQIGADISGTGGLTKTGAGVLSLTGTNNTYTGATTISGGGVRIGSVSNLPSASNIQLNGGVLELAGDIPLTSGAGAGQVQWIGSGGFSTYGGDRTINLNSGADVTWGSSGFVTASGTFVLGSAGSNGTVTFANNIDLGGVAETVSVNAGSAAIDAILSGTLSNGSLTVNGSGVLQLGAANTYTGSTVLQGGTLAVTNLEDGGTASSIGAGSNAASNLVLAGGVLSYTGAGSRTDRLFQVGTGTSNNGAAGTLDSSGSGAVAFTNTGSLAYGQVNKSRDLTLQGSNTGENILAASIGNNGSGAVRVDKLGTGKWTLSGSNSYTDVTYIYEGILSAAGNAALGNTANVTVLDGATLDLNNANTGSKLFYIYGAGVGNDGALTATGTSTISGTIRMDNSDHISIGGAGTLNLNAYIREIYAGTTLTKVGSGTLIVNNPQIADGLEYIINEGKAVLNTTSYTSISGTLATVNSGGTLQLAGVGGNQINDYAALLINSGGLFDLNGRNETISAINGAGTVTNTALATSSTLTVGVSEYNPSSAFSGGLQDGAGALALVKSGTGAFTMTGANTYSGGTILNSGTLVAGNDSALGAGSVTLNGGVLSGSGARTLPNAWRVTGDAEIGGASNLTFTNTLTNTGGDHTLTVTNVGTTTLSAVNLSNDDTGHILTINATGGPVLVTSAIADGGAGAGEFDKDGAGTLILSASSSYAGNTTIYAGLLSITDANALGSTAGYTDVYGGATLELNNVTNVGENIYFDSAGVDGQGAITSTGTSSVNGAVYLKSDGAIGVSDSLTLNGSVNNDAELDKLGAGTLTFSGSTDNAALRVTVDQGTVILAKDSSPDVHCIGYGLTVNSGGVAQLAGTGGDQIFTDATVSVNSDGVLDLNGRSEGFASLLGSGTVTNTAAATTSTLILGEDDGYSEFAGTLQDGAGALALVKTGGSDLVLSGENTYTGGTEIGGSGAVELRNTGALGSAGVISFTGGTLRYTEENAVDYSARFSSADGQQYKVDTNGQNVTFAGALGSNGATFEKYGDGTLTLSGSNALGEIGVFKGLLRVTSDSGAGKNNNDPSQAAWIYDGATLELAGVNVNKTVALGPDGGHATLAGTGTSSSTGDVYLLADSAIDVGAASRLTISGQVMRSANYASAPALTKTGDGTLVLSGSDDYAGATIVSAGTLLVMGDNAASAGTTVENGGKLGGTGKVGNVAVESGGALSPGASPGLLTVDGDLTMAAGALLTMEFTGTGLGAFDQIAIRDFFTAGGTLFLDVSYAADAGDTFTIFTDGLAGRGWNAGSFTIATNLGGGLAWDTSALGASGVVSIVPEPSALALAAIGLVASSMLCQRRRSASAPAEGSSWREPTSSAARPVARPAHI